ncbi:molybdenum cofactor guanylyltransferase [Edaphobacter sp. 12200R-103]|jgi:molybdopterin-guanine dinucleotide biosynthesis protein A|uniref:molybdenum cofactor guanylyltransferase n=1 Tax=Edaphobacter sp. 12200R-103 TaxID=2703788 RepID=UPI00138D8001|nr:molybdenum cofactor guanylyltransferase [Edaphobacter sp. 12200R-103]QHS51495.1 molybdenum cofactor guanylyltransferase [Edaphobacter sp. 12200R-103]
MTGPSLAGFVLAGGRSSRMGQDKALLPLDSVPLIQRAVWKLRKLTSQVCILGSRPELSPFAPLVPDLRESCGPLGGMEAALSHTLYDWSLVLPVDMPFLPAALLRCWANIVVSRPSARVACFVVDDVPQPALCLLHREMLPFLTEAAQQGRFKLYPALVQAALQLATRSGSASDAVFLQRRWMVNAALPLLRELQAEAGEESREFLSPAQRAASNLWFENLNTPEQFAEAQQHLDAVEA